MTAQISAYSFELENLLKKRRLINKIITFASNYFSVNVGGN